MGEYWPSCPGSAAKVAPSSSQASNPKLSTEKVPTCSAVGAEFLNIKESCPVMRMQMLGLKSLTLACCPICGCVPALQGAYRGHWARYVPCQCNMRHCNRYTTTKFHKQSERPKKSTVPCQCNMRHCAFYTPHKLLQAALDALLSID